MCLTVCAICSYNNNSYITNCYSDVSDRLHHHSMMPLLHAIACNQRACVLEFMPMADILNICYDYQFVFSVCLLDELHASHHWSYSKTAL